MDAKRQKKQKQQQGYGCKGRRHRLHRLHDEIISIPTTVRTEKEDDTDSTATVATAAATLFSASEWDDDIMTTVESSATWNEQNVFGKRRWVKPDRKWKTPTPRANIKENHTKLDKIVDARSRKIDGVFMFGCAAKEMTKNLCSLTTLQELPSPQDVIEAREKNRREPKPWSEIGKFKVRTEKTTRGSWVLDSKY